MKKAVKLIKAAALLGQFGFSVITPPVFLTLGAWWLQRRFDLGVWIMIAAIAVGILTAVSSGYRMLRRVLETPQEEKQSKTVSFYSHE